LEQQARSGQQRQKIFRELVLPLPGKLELRRRRLRMEMMPKNARKRLGGGSETYKQQPFRRV
jgi:hypothetical protein